MDDLNTTINQPDLIDIIDYSTQRLIEHIGHILGHETNLNKYERI
jgi:hypothetical protein